MDLLINGKRFEKWTADDVSIILNNSDFSESEFIEYKTTFAFYDAEKPEDRQRKTNEFKHDICSFANTSGGYLFAGIIEERGIPTSICGVSIKNSDTDRLEQDLRNKLTGIQPAMPTIAIRCVPLQNGHFVVAIKVFGGSDIPYV